MHSRRAATLVELMVAIAIFTILMIAVMQCLTSSKAFVNQSSTETDLDLECQTLTQKVVNDFSSCAWNIPAVADGGPATVPTDQMTIPSDDRSILYYPYVQVQDVTGVGSQFQTWNRVGTALVLNPASLPAGLPASHYLPTQEVIFTKVRRGPAQIAPAQVVPFSIDFNTPPRSIAQFTADRASPNPALEEISGVPVESLLLQVASGTGIISDLPLKWETVSDSPPPTPNTWVREFGYVIVPNPVTGKGRLERWYRNGSSNASGATPQADATLSEDADRLTVDTYRTDSTLNMDQVRVRIYLSRAMEDNQGRYLSKTVDITIALRSNANGLNSVDLSSRLGSGGGYSVH